MQKQTSFIKIGFFFLIYKRFDFVSKQKYILSAFLFLGFFCNWKNSDVCFNFVIYLFFISIYLRCFSYCHKIQLAKLSLRSIFFILSNNWEGLSFYNVFVQLLNLETRFRFDLILEINKTSGWKHGSLTE